MATPLVVDITERLQPKFKKHPHKSVEVNPLGTLSDVPHGVLHVEDIRAYIHASIHEFGDSKLLDLFKNHLRDENHDLKHEYKALEDKHFIQVIGFPSFDEDEWVRYVPNQMHAEFMWLMKPFKITNQ